MTEKMTEHEIKQIYSYLLDVTRARRLKWKKTGNYEYTVSFSRSSVTLYRDWEYEDPPVVMNILNEDGLAIAYASARELYQSESVYSFTLDPSELYELVEEQVYKYSETSKNILDELGDTYREIYQKRMKS